MSKQEAQQLYAGKTFYIKRPDGSLDGPREDIYYARGGLKYKFIQIVDGVPVRAYTETEILVKQG